MVHLLRKFLPHTGGGFNSVNAAIASANQPTPLLAPLTNLAGVEMVFVGSRTVSAGGYAATRWWPYPARNQ